MSSTVAVQLSADALWGELAASVAADAASKGIKIDLQVDDGTVEASHDSAGALRVYRNLTLAAVRLAARDTCLRIRVSSTGEQQRIHIESVSSCAEDGRARLFRATRSVPTEADFALHAARAFLRSHGGSIDACYMPNLGIRATLELPLRASGRTSSISL